MLRSALWLRRKSSETEFLEREVLAAESLSSRPEPCAAQLERLPASSDFLKLGGYFFQEKSSDRRNSTHLRFLDILFPRVDSGGTAYESKIDFRATGRGVSDRAPANQQQHPSDPQNIIECESISVDFQMVSTPPLLSQSNCVCRHEDPR